MNYLTLTFASFVLILFIVFYLVPKKVRGFVLLFGSLFFYGCFDLRYLIFLLVVAISTFIAAKFINKSERPKMILCVCIILNVIMWFVIKVLPWTCHTIVRFISLFDANVTEPTLNLLVPIGISYYMLQAISYIADVYTKKLAPEKHFGKYLLFLSYFPAIVQGPISRFSQLMPQLLHQKNFSFDQMRTGLLLILFGLVKKMVLADRIGIFVDYCFENYTDLGGVTLYLGAVLYSIQLYADFSGCVDICRGVSNLFGIELIHNFNRPYLSGSVKEFWGRWHMSLSSWLKDYVYIPLGGNRRGISRKYINLLLTFLVSGVWHGAGFSFIFWGLLHALYQIIESMTESIRSKIKKIIGIKTGSISEKIYQIVITFHLVTFAWIFFRAIGFRVGLEYVQHMLSSANLWALFDGSLFTYGVSQNYFILILIHIIVLIFIEWQYSRQEHVVNNILQLHIGIRWIIYLVLLFDVLLFGVYGSGYSLSSFMYGGF